MAHNRPYQRHSTSAAHFRLPGLVIPSSKVHHMLMLHVTYTEVDTGCAADRDREAA